MASCTGGDRTLVPSPGGRGGKGVCMRLLKIVIVMLVAASFESGHAVEIAKEGRATCVIVIADDAPATDKTAAKELAEQLSAVTGGTFDIKVESDVPADAPQILVGPSKRARELVGDVDWTALGPDGIVIKTAGPHLVLTGAPAAPRGTIYAVHTFLEDHVGLRWWTSTESHVPRKSSLSFDAIDVTYAPKLRYREAFYRDNARNPTHAVRLKLNGQHNAIPSEWGGHVSLIGWCHTFYSLVSPSHFAKHPEWFSEINGQRTTAGQLCLSNDAMRAELTKNALAWIKANPSAGMVSVSQNDNKGACTCKACA